MILCFGSVYGILEFLLDTMLSAALANESAEDLNIPEDPTEYYLFLWLMELSSFKSLIIKVLSSCLFFIDCKTDGVWMNDEFFQVAGWNNLKCQIYYTDFSGKYGGFF